MSEFFIVASNQLQEFETLPEALVHKRDLERHVRDAEHKVYRCKGSLVGADHFTKMVALLADIQRDGLTPANADRIRVMFFTLGNRTPKLQTLTRASGPPEYRGERR